MQSATPDATVSIDAGWTIVGAATAHEAVQSLDDDTSYVRCNTEGDEVVFGFPSFTDPGVDTGHAVSFRARRQGIGFVAQKLKLKLYSGAVLLGEQEFTTEIEWQTLTWSVPSGVAAGIDNYADVRLGIEDVLTGALVHHRVSWVQALIPAPVLGTEFNQTPAWDAYGNTAEAVVAYGSLDTEVAL